VIHVLDQLAGAELEARAEGEGWHRTLRADGLKAINQANMWKDEAEKLRRQHNR
jgi:hypothetical protein